MLRMTAHGGVALLIILISLLMGVLGYHTLAGLSVVDSILNAAMILGGMGPVDSLKSDSAKLFAAAYALYSGLILLVSVGILMAPLLHRLLHRFHLQSEED